MGSELTDAAVLERSIADPAVFAIVYERHLERVHSYLRRRLGDGVAEDVTAEVFIRAFRSRASYDALHPTALPWLFGIVGHAIGDHRRAERRRLAALARLTARRDHMVADPAVAELDHELAEALRRLPVADRDTLLLVVWGELSYDDAATALGVPVGTVRSRIARARARLIRSGGLGGHARSTDFLMNGEANA